MRAVKLAAVTADRLRPSRPGIVVLIYHRVGGRSPLQVDLPTSLYRSQMEALAASGRVITLDEAAALLSAGRELESDRIVITFDDGTADFADEAVPVLADLHLPATLYLATAFVEEQRPFPDEGAPLSWSALADAVATGLVTVGSHTHRHALLDRLPPGEVADELDRSIELIGSRLGVTPDHFAYPKAVAGSAAAEAEVRQRFRSAALAGTRANHPGKTDLYRLARSPIQVADGMEWFERKAAGGMALEDALRRVANRRRYAGATT